MAASVDPVTCKESFLQNNQIFLESKLTEESKSIGNLQDFDLVNNEIWLLQCPKGTDVSELENQTLKMPGRSSINNSEAISMEFNEGKKQQAFAYYNRKGRYGLRLLPVRGTIVVRDRLKAAETITTERVTECCPPAKRVPLPAGIRVRHPLFGVDYEDKIDLDKSIVKRLQKADKISAQILKDSLNKNSKVNSSVISGRDNAHQGNTIIPIDSNSSDNVSEEEIKKTKRKNSESNAESSAGQSSNKKKIKKSNKTDEVSKDLQWLQNI